MVAANFVRHTMINLKIAAPVVGGTYPATRIIPFNQDLLKGLWPSLTPAKFPASCLSGITKSVCADFSSMRPGDTERFERDALLSHVACRSRWVIIPIFWHSILPS